MAYRSVKSFAKINLGLLITGKRQDGYHTLETIFAPINWYDTIEFTRSDVISMSCSNIDLPVDDNNLCIKAARALQQFASYPAGAAMNLHKQVPFGAGLGGGSSDAATVLRVLNDLWQINASTAELHALAVKLGADVPYFLEMKGLAFARGIGDELEDLDLTLPFHVVTVFPEEHVSTVWAYKNFYRKFERPVPSLKLLLRQLCLDGDRSVLGAFENDFEPVVFDHYPKVRVVKEDLLDAGSFYASLSGSGSAVFGLFDTQENAGSAVSFMQQKGYRVTLTPPGFFME
ncbi:MAG: 4-(cytidine 5'-diphospho)-2-C-methyl-D-erythritol kinase [Chlorobiaceae bacterium]|nr:4-(cytidine 5'-diphospho)-2-C-methyl-D-erythritol kinase [Chlorobiaceae bacterium]NTW63053.1 4-(cytidine 5'-diphospho)-2-C-methyl-D-erythritol kinase [Chlorobiaceae bacterium]